MKRHPILSASIRDFFQEQEIILENVRFEYLEGRYSGKGQLTWNPEKGFHLLSFVERKGPPKPLKAFGGYRLIRQIDRRTIRLSPRGKRGWAIAPKVNLTERLDVSFEERLSVNLSSVIFSFPIEQAKESYIGSSLYYGIDNRIILPDTVKEEIGLQDFQSKSFSADGISLDEPEYQFVRGIKIKDDYLKLNWILGKSHWSRAQAWNWPLSARDALSILTGRTMSLVCREVERGTYILSEMRRQIKVTNLGFLAPLPEAHPLNKERFARLVEFFTLNSPEADICRKMYYQMAEASRQKSWQATELLLATILEAALRTLQEKPYQEGKRSGRGLDIKQGLKRFRDEYLTNKWNSWCDRANEVQKRLRNRNAHPDWLYTEGDVPSDEKRLEALEDMVFLSRFYGYMILALSGEKELKPEFSKKLIR